jgi:hypothetical protein
MPGCTDAVIAERVTKRFGKVLALDGVDLRVRQGTVHALLGPNGAGKPVTELRPSLPPGAGRWTGRRLASTSAAVCRSPETARYARPQDLPSPVAAGAPPNYANNNAEPGHRRLHVRLQWPG